jgi:hypothetical protein
LAWSSQAHCPDRAFDRVTPQPARVRTTNPAIAHLLADGAAVATFVTELERFERRHWVMFVERGPRPAIVLHVIGRLGVRRWLRILTNEWELGPSRPEIIAIAHELHHAIEVAEAPEVSDAASLAAHFRRIGEGRASSQLLASARTIRGIFEIPNDQKNPSFRPLPSIPNWRTPK